MVVVSPNGTGVEVVTSRGAIGDVVVVVVTVVVVVVTSKVSEIPVIANKDRLAV
jgi:hypothetical protein